MSPYLWNSFLILAIARGLYHLLRPHFGTYGQLVFWAVVSIFCISSFCTLAFVAAPLTMIYAGIWAALGLAGWFIPELWQHGLRLLQELLRRAGRVPPLRLLLLGAIALSIIIAVVNPDTIGQLGTIWALVGAIALIITKGFSLGAKPAKRRRR